MDLKGRFGKGSGIERGTAGARRRGKGRDGFITRE